MDTGSTISLLIAHLESKGASSVSVCTFLDKPSRRKVHFKLLGNGKFYRGFEVHTSYLPYIFCVFPACTRCFVDNKLYECEWFVYIK